MMEKVIGVCGCKLTLFYDIILKVIFKGVEVGIWILIRVFSILEGDRYFKNCMWRDQIGERYYVDFKL